MKRQITDSISKNLIHSDLESNRKMFSAEIHEFNRIGFFAWLSFLAKEVFPRFRAITYIFGHDKTKQLRKELDGKCKARKSRVISRLIALQHFAQITLL